MIMTFAQRSMNTNNGAKTYPGNKQNSQEKFNQQKNDLNEIKGRTQLIN